MVDETNGLDEAALAVAARHALHDEELISALADGGADAGPEHDRARSLVARCAACRDLLADLELIRAVARSTDDAPALAPRDFRLNPEVAHQLRPFSPVAGWRTRLRDAVSVVGRPLGGALATFGVVGLLVGSIGLGFGAQSAAAPTSGGALGPAATAAAGGQFEMASGQPAKASDSRNQAYVPPSTELLHSDTGQPAAPQSGETRDADAGPSPLSVLLAGSGVALATGLGLLVLTARLRRRTS